jgi:hypothetical protein
MRGIRKVDTKPELVVPRAAHRRGYRLRLHRRGLPDTLGLVFPRGARRSSCTDASGGFACLRRAMAVVDARLEMRTTVEGRRCRT